MAGVISDVTQKWAGYGENFTTDDAQSTIQYTCSWALRNGCKYALLGSQHSDLSNLVCHQVGIEPLGDADASAGGPQTALLSADFRPFTNEGQVNEDWSKWKERWSAGGDAITLGEGTWRWGTVTGDVVLNQDVSSVIVAPTATIILSGRTANLAAGDKTTILNAQGKVNSGATTIKGFSYGAEKLLLLGADLSEGTDGDGNTIYSIAYKFSYKHANTWNTFLDKRADSPTWTAVVAANGESPYSDTSFSALDPSGW